MKRAAPILFAFSLLFVAGCSKGNFSQRASEGKADVFRYPIVTNPTSLDPQMVQDGDTIDLLQNVYEGLVGWNEQNVPSPKIAESWDVEDGGTTYVFHLRRGVKFHNGREVTADDFKFGFERACNPKLASPVAASYLGDILGVTERLRGQAKEVAGVQVVDPYTLKIQIDKPRAYFLAKLTYPVYWPVPKEAVDFDKEMTSASQAIGAGPYKMIRYEKDQIVVLEANKDYYGGAPKVAQIERPVITDATTRLNKFKSGELDLVPLERQDVKALAADPEYKGKLRYFPRPAIWYIGLNVQKYPPFARRDVRRALAMAIDKRHIVQDLLDGINTEANSILPPGVYGFREKADSIPYDPEGAKKLLAQAGYPAGKGLPPVTIYYRADRPDIETVASEVATELRKTLGMQINQQSMEWRAYLDKNNKKQLPFFHMRWAADYLDPQNFLSLMLTTNGGENKTYYSNLAYDALCEKADTSQDPEERKKLYAKAEDMVLQDAAWIPIYFQRDVELISPRVKDLKESLFGHLPHTSVTLGG
jgi:oligopeptide transport system substrate-binding protein